MNLNGLFRLEFMMFAEICVGYLLCACHILKPSDRSVFSRAVLYVFFPCNIISSFNTELNPVILMKFLQVLLISAAIQIFSVFLAAVCFRHTDQQRRKVLRFAIVCSNAGFLGNAVAEGVYGSAGMLFGQIYLIPLRIAMWSAGVSYFAGESDWRATVRKVLTHPCIIAVMIGLVRMTAGVPFPEIVDSTLISLGRCSSPLILLFIGMILADSGFSTMFSKLNLQYAVLRLFLIPAAVLAGCLLVHADPMITGLSVLLAAMPAGNTTAVLAEQYHADVRFAADCVVLSTILSLAALPLWAYFLSNI